MASLSTCVPREIWRVIFSFATVAPSGLLSDCDVIRLSDLRDLQEAINVSFEAKCSLSLTCRLFHELMDEFLFEIIVVRRSIRLHCLSDLLQQTRTDGVSRGWWCRMLYIQLKEVGLHCGENSVGDRGRFTLWGLIEACPNVVALSCSIVSLPSPNLVWGHGNHDLYIPRQLLQLIARTYGPALRRLELFGGRVHVTDMVRLLSSCPSLEVCRLVALDSGDWCESKDGRPHAPAASSFEDSSARTSVTEILSADTADLADWPTTSSDIVSLPKLKTLAGIECVGDIRKWMLPSLSTVRAQMFIGVPRMHGVLNWFVDNLTIYSAQIKRVSYAGAGFSFWPLIDLLCVVESIKVPVDMDFSPSTLPSTHAFLGEIQINSHLLGRMEVRTVEVLNEVLLVARAGRLPALRSIEIHNSLVDPDTRAMVSLTKEYRSQMISLDLEKQTAVTSVGIFETDHSRR